jgi:hypothetical protein
MTNNTPAATTANNGCVLALRVRGRNPNHHLWFNNGSWWMHYTVHLPDHTKHRVRCSLQTANLSLARARRDALFAEFGAIWKEAA